MARSFIAGGTDYSAQSFDDLIADLISTAESIENDIALFEKHLSLAQKNGYWDDHTPYDFKAIIGKAIAFLKNSANEMREISIEIQSKVESNHISQLKHIGTFAHEISKDITLQWHREYPAEFKDYKNTQFSSIEQIYAITGDATNFLMDISNLADRLATFKGKRKKMKFLEKIVFISASIEREPRLRVDKEAREIESQISSSKHRNEIYFKQKTAAKYEDISKTLLEDQPSILHFSGHSNQKVIQLENNDNNGQDIPISSFNHLLKTLKGNLKLVILNSCYTENQAKILSNNGIYVIGMKVSIMDEAAIEFSKGFYQSLSSGQNIETSFNVGRAFFNVEDKINFPVMYKDGIKL